ncbi:MAG: carboxypeptidase-like regulatory domain-containing protein [Alistipes sp.]|jgi:hypothetical protein|nr:carboxypeptidase-like regulatory domain-containing protein [Alistipes sp.]
MLNRRFFKTTLLSLLFAVSAALSFALPGTHFPAAVPTTPTLAQTPKGTIKGTVLDAATGEPLVGTTVIIEGTTIGTTSGADGGFTISNITPGGVSIIAQYLGYEVFRQNVIVRSGAEVSVEVSLRSEGISLDDVLVIARIDNESENVLLSGQREAVAAIQSVGAGEMSRKGIGDARAAVAQVSGVSRQEGVKNVFVRGLGDRYNATYLNGFPVPSEDPEYKNIALEFFGSDIIRNIGVGKVFGAANGGDVGGAVIDINSKVLVDRRALSVSLDGGVNSAAANQAEFAVENMTIELRNAYDATKFMQNVLRVRRHAVATVTNSLVKGTGCVENLVNLEGGATGGADVASEISISNELDNEPTKTTIKVNEGLTAGDYANVAVEDGNAGCAASLFAWTGYEF